MKTQNNNLTSGAAKRNLRLAYADRLKPRTFTRDPPTEKATASPNKVAAGSNSPAQARARSILKKYRAHVRNQEFKRLRSVVPAVADNDKASKAEILEETISYINSLHQQLLERIQCNGLPSKLREHANQVRLVGPSSSGRVSAEQSTSDSSAVTQRLSDSQTSDWTTSDVAALMSNALEPQLEASLRQKRHLDRLREKRVIAAVTSSTQ